jgi:ATP-dependent protease ClpP protease subunit
VNAGRLLELVDRARGLMPAAPPEARSGEWFRIRNADTDRAEVFIYGVIGSDWDPGDVTAASFVAELRKITAPAIDLHVNSPGGLVFDGIAIYSALLNHPATVDVTVDGIAASAASFVSMAGNSVAIEKPAKMMIHDASGLVIGNAADMQEMADVLNELSDTIAGIYADRAGGPVAQWRDAMKRETWYSADAAVKAGLADRVANDATEAAPTDRRSQMIRARARVHAVKG